MKILYVSGPGRCARATRLIRVALCASLTACVALAATAPVHAQDAEASASGNAALNPDVSDAKAAELAAAENAALEAKLEQAGATIRALSLIHISEPTRLLSISY